MTVYVVSELKFDRSNFVFLPSSGGEKTLFFAALQMGKIKRPLIQASGERLHRLPVVPCGVQLVTELRSKGQVSAGET